MSIRRANKPDSGQAAAPRGGKPGPGAPAGRSGGHALPVLARLDQVPWWLLAAGLTGLILLWQITSRSDYRSIFLMALQGLGITLRVSLAAYVCATLLGLGIGLLRVSHRRVLREIGTFWVEIVRGVPMLVILYYITFVGAPSLAGALGLDIRLLGFEFRAALALTVGYSAFIAEIFRAGIESIHRGQLEAAMALGLSRGQAMRHVILPQAIRTVLPPLGNEFVAMIKDSALVSVLGVQDITQLGKVYAASSFTFFETYNVVAYLYLVLTVSLSLLVRALENRLNRHKRH